MPGGHVYNGLAWNWLWLLLALALASGICAAQLIPTAEYLAQSQRSAAVDYEYALNYSFWPWHLITIAAPGFFGSPASGDYWGASTYWEDALYVGSVALIIGERGAIGKPAPKGEDKTSRG